MNHAFELRLRRAAKKVMRIALPLLMKALHPKSWKTRPATPGEPKNILILNPGHIGDMVLSTSILPILRSAYPNAKIGFVMGSWARMALKNHPGIAYFHTVDHWIANRGENKLLKKLSRYRQTKRQALEEIRAVGYDVALCVHPSLCDFLDLTWQAGIPVRAGFHESVLASFATHLANLPSGFFVHQSVRQAEVLRSLGVDPNLWQLMKSSMGPSSAKDIAEVCALLEADKIEDAHYRIIHMGSGALNREQSPAFWHEVASELSKKHTILFTGAGSREEANAHEAIGGLSNCINACNKLSWDGFVAAVTHAEVLYGVESMAGHVAAAVGTKCVVSYAGNGGVARWRPEGDLVIVETNHLECAPCLHILGCEAMTCLRGVSPSDIYVEREAL
jgi:ADP-heptose:LPS heptosyltransferase